MRCKVDAKNGSTCESTEIQELSKHQDDGATAKNGGAEDACNSRNRSET